MKLMHYLKVVAVTLLIAMTQLAAAAQAAVAQKTYASPEQAVSMLVDTIRRHDLDTLTQVIGPGAPNWLSSGDDAADQQDMNKFLAAYDRKNSISKPSGERAILLVGDDDWAFPAPIVRKGKSWIFDGAAGREESVNRRIGRNELDVIQTLLAIVDAQREYAAGDTDGNGTNDYARRFISSPGKKDGLYWLDKDGRSLSPLGPLVGAAAPEYAPEIAGEDLPTAYHGYRYRILTAQGKDAPGGAYSYLVGDHMLGGFAIVAYPAKYSVSGVMSFMVSHDGVVYQKNLGKNTESHVLGMHLFNPDKSWHKVP